MKTDVYLASSSPRRMELLAQLGVRFAVLHPLVDETRLTDESAKHYVARLALDKVRAGRRLLLDDEPPIQNPVIGADTCIAIDDEPVGKPVDKQHFMQLMAQLSGATHRVYTAVAIAGNTLSSNNPLLEMLPSAPQEKCLVSCTSVQFREISHQEREWYWQCGEPLDKAGGYAIQGLGAAFVESIRGSYSGVVGLPLFETAQLLNDFSVNVLQLAQEKNC